MIRKYYWNEYYDGGKGSVPFNTEKEAIADAKRHVSDLRFTKKELERIRKNYGHIYIGYIDFDDDADEEDFAQQNGDLIDTGNSIEISEKTLDRLY